MNNCTGITNSLEVFYSKDWIEPDDVLVLKIKYAHHIGHANIMASTGIKNTMNILCVDIYVNNNYVDTYNVGRLTTIYHFELDLTLYNILIRRLAMIFNTTLDVIALEFIKYSA